MACGEDDKELYAAAQSSSEGGGGCDRTESVSPVTAPEQRYAHEEPETSRTL